MNAKTKRILYNLLVMMIHFLTVGCVSTVLFTKLAVHDFDWQLKHDIQILLSFLITYGGYFGVLFWGRKKKLLSKAAMCVSLVWELLLLVPYGVLIFLWAASEISLEKIFPVLGQIWYPLLAFSVTVALRVYSLKKSRKEQSSTGDGLREP